ncbi:hypothetical protein M8J75_000941 [Diaphorina citri]|nr:hypothetical protein M8J75_000941 [Diaphorina citri]
MSLTEIFVRDYPMCDEDDFENCKNMCFCRDDCTDSAAEFCLKWCYLEGGDTCSACVHASCSATLKLSRDKTSIVGGIFTHARHSPVGPSVKPAFRSSASERSSANTTPLSSSKSAKSSPLPRTPSGHNSTSSSFDFEFSTPLVKPPRNGTSLSTRASTYSFDSPPPSLPKSNSHDGLGSSSSHDTIVLKDDSFFPDVPENAHLLQRIDELVTQRDALIGKIQELSSKLEVNSSTTQVPKTDFSVNRIAIFSDSMCRGVSKIIHDEFCSSAKVSSLVKPNANFFQSLYQCALNF